MPSTALAFTKSVGKGYCLIRHPVEALTSDRSACESQHVIQQQRDGEHQRNTIWISTTHHTYLDRSSCKPWEYERPAFAWLADLNMERAYMTGVWAQGYHFFIYDHHGDGQLTLFEWDGATHLLYLISTISNYPQKQVNQIAYQIERYRKGQTTQMIDTAIAIPIDLAEVAIGVFYSVAGMVIGTVLNPIDTLRNIVSLFTLGATSIFNAVWLLLKGAVAVATLGTFGSCGL
ncbi:hypothetical protein OZ408_002465 [Pseudomonas aeruginosa]|nr:hypothetical protein [Pseudomonas aeruginosa]